MVGQQNLKRVAKAIYKMAALWCLESLGPHSAEAALVTPGEGTCFAANEPVYNSSETFWLWVALAWMFVLWMIFAAMTYIAWKKVTQTFATVGTRWQMRAPT